MRSLSFGSLVLGSLFFASSALGLPQEPPPVAETPAASSDAKAQFDAAMTDYNTKRAAALDCRTKLRTAKREEIDALTTEYKKCVEEIRVAIDKLYPAAEAAYKAAPNQDEKVTIVLLGVARDKILADRYEDAKSILQVLADNKCPQRELSCLQGVVAYCMDDFDEAEKLLTAAKEGDALAALSMAESFLIDCPDAKAAWKKEQEWREAEKTDNLPRVKLETSKGALVIELYENEAPETVGNFVNLVEKKFYDGLTFHRVLGNFMAQGGCPLGTGTGGPGYDIYCECKKSPHRDHFRGTLSMAKERAPNTGGSQFFLTFRRTSHLDGEHTVFGRVIEGLEILQELQRIDPEASSGVKPDRIIKAEVVRKRDHAYEPNKVK